MSVKEATVLLGGLQLVPCKHSSHTCLELDDQEELVWFDLVANLFNLFKIALQLARGLALNVLVSATAGDSHIFLFFLNFLYKLIK